MVMYAGLGLGQVLYMIGQFGCLSWFCRLYTYRMENGCDVMRVVCVSICQE